MAFTDDNFTPATFNTSVMEKNAIPKDMANRGCMTVDHTGRNPCVNTPRTRSIQPSGCSALALDCTPEVASSIRSAKPAGGSTSGNAFNQLKPAWVSSNMEAQALQDVR